MSLLKVNEIQIFNGTTVTITATTTETSADLNVGADLDVTGALTLGTALAITEGGTGATTASGARTALGLAIGTDVQAYDADTTKNDVSNTFTANQVISVADNTNAALRITQTGTGNALLVEDSSNPDSTPFVVDASGNVGIGTSSPAQKLDVTGNINATGALTLGTALAVAEGGTGATDAATARTNLDVDQAGTDNSTDVTLVTTSHDYLSIAGQAITLGPIDLSADVTGTLAASNGGTGVTALSSLNAADLGSGAATDGYVLTADGAGGAAWEAASGISLPIDLLSSGASIRKSDGTTTVLSESSGVVTLANTSLGDSVLMPDNSNNVSTAPGIRFEADTDTGIGLASAGNLAIVTGGSERMRIDSSGNVGIGTVSPATQLTVYRTDSGTSNGALRLDGNGNYAGLQFAASGSLKGSISADNSALYLTHGAAFEFKTGATNNGGGTERMRIDSSGNVKINNLSASSDVQTDASKNLITTSDARLKNDLGVITDSAINVVQQIIPKYFSWKNDESNSQQLGFFAQDIYPVLPEAAPRALKYIENGKDENNQPILEQVLDEEGNPDYEWGFTDRPIIAMCVKAIQEQQTLIESQQSQIDDLTARIEALEV